MGTSAMEALTASRLAWSLLEIANFNRIISCISSKPKIRAGRLPIKKIWSEVLVLHEDLLDYLAKGSPGNKSS